MQKSRSGGIPGWMHSHSKEASLQVPKWWSESNYRHSTRFTLGSTNSCLGVSNETEQNIICKVVKKLPSRPKVWVSVSVSSCTWAYLLQALSAKSDPSPFHLWKPLYSTVMWCSYTMKLVYRACPRFVPTLPLDRIEPLRSVVVSFSNSTNWSCLYRHKAACTLVDITCWSCWSHSEAAWFLSLDQRRRGFALTIAKSRAYDEVE